jgi:hypothetical protein
MTVKRLAGIYAAPLLAVVLATACGGSGGSPTAPSGGAPSRSVTLDFRVFNSTEGQVKALTRTATPNEAFTVLVSELGVAGVDAERIVVRRRATNTLGVIVTASPCWDSSGSSCSGASAAGKATWLPTEDAALDVFLMNAKNGANYNCMDAPGDKGWSWALMQYGRDATLRMAPPGEEFHGYHATSGPEEAMSAAAAVASAALNPFGIKYGQITYVGATGPLRMTGIFSREPLLSDRFGTASGLSFGADGIAVNWSRPMPLASTISVILHELTHSYFGAPDYYDSPGCGSHLDSVAGINSNGTLSPKGRDAFAYWALRYRLWEDSH